MSIWFYLFLIVLFIAIFFVLKVLIMKQEIKNIGSCLTDIINTDTNNLITINTNDKKLKELANLLNDSLKNLRKRSEERRVGKECS